jgi:3-hydroxybutyryl-CoA dehydratase
MEMVYRKRTLHVGDFALFPKTVSASDVMLFCGESGDMSPLYLNAEFGRSTCFGGAVVPPMLVAAMMGGAVFRLLSPDACPVRREFSALRPLAVGDTLTCRAEITDIDAAACRVTVALDAYNSAGDAVAHGVSVEQTGLRKGGGTDAE